MGSTWARIGHDQAADEELIAAATRYLGYPRAGQLPPRPAPLDPNPSGG